MSNIITSLSTICNRGQPVCLLRETRRIGWTSQSSLRAPQPTSTIARQISHRAADCERLRGQLSGLWSRRLTQEHRVVYQVEADTVAFLQARYHY